MSLFVSSRDGLRNVLRHAPRHSTSIRTVSSSLSSTPASSSSSTAPLFLRLSEMQPRHIYRRILRHAHSIAKRWKDPYIFWTLKHLAMRHLGHRRGLDGTPRSPRIQAERWGLQQKQPRHRTISSSNDTDTDTERTLAAYKRLQRLCKHTANADRGTKPEMLEIFKQTYALAGPNMHMAKKKLLDSYLFSDRKPETAGQHFPSHPPSPLALALLQSPTACHNPMVKNDEAWAGLIAQYHEYRPTRIQKAGIKILRKMPLARLTKARLSKITPPMPFEVVRDLEARMDYVTKQYIQMKISAGTQLAPEQGQHQDEDATEEAQEEEEYQATPDFESDLLPDQTRKGPLHPSSPDFLRSQRRLYGFLLNDLTALITVDELKRAWGRTGQSYPSMQSRSLPPLPDTVSPTDYWLNKPHLQFTLQTLWCSKLRLTPQDLHNVYMRTNDKLRQAGQVLPMQLPTKADQQMCLNLPKGSSSSQDAATDILWIYKSRMAIARAGSPSSSRNNVMLGSEAFVSQQEAEMAREFKTTGSGDQKRKSKEGEQGRRNPVHGETAQADRSASQP